MGDGGREWNETDLPVFTPCEPASPRQRVIQRLAETSLRSLRLEPVRVGPRFEVPFVGNWSRPSPKRSMLRPARLTIIRLSVCVVLTNSLRVSVLRGGAQKRGEAQAAQKDAAAAPQVFRFPDGSMYRGGVLDGMQHGEGEWRSAEGDVYVGGFARGAFEGSGRYKDARGNVFIGDFRAGSYHGAGTYLYADGRAECSLYEAGADRGEGVRWSMDRARVWRLRDGRVVGEISLREGAAVCHTGLELRPSRLKIDLPLTR